MAKASKKLIRVVEENEYTLTLNEKEIQTLTSILGYIGGSPTRSRRKYADSIAEALRTIGFDINTDSKDINSFSRAIHFEDEVV